jgi:putative membrane protein
MNYYFLANASVTLLLNSVLYSVIGIVILVIAFAIVEKLTPKHNLWKEIVENKNVALAIVAGFFMLAIAIIIASAIH